MSPYASKMTYYHPTALGIIQRSKHVSAGLLKSRAPFVVTSFHYPAVCKGQGLQMGV